MILSWKDKKNKSQGASECNERDDVVQPLIFIFERNNVERKRNNKRNEKSHFFFVLLCNPKKEKNEIKDNLKKRTENHV